MTLAEAKALLERPTITVEQFAEIFGLSLSGAYEAVSREDVAHTRIGKSIRIISQPLKARLGLEKIAA